MATPRPPAEPHDVGDELLVPVIAGLLHRHLEEVRETYGARLPRLRSPEFLAAPTDAQTAVLVFLGSTWMWGMPGLAVLKEASLDVHGAVPRGYWVRAAAQPSFSELQRRRGLLYDPQSQRWTAA
jgi:hypothetical protein